MGYLDNPRKIYGKVEIVYSDSDVSGDIDTEESENSEISHPDEVHGSALTPTVKAATMDGNSVMDGNYQIIDDSCICGWWSGNLSSSTGRFLTDTYIELSFLSRPVSSWTVVGDSKRGEYPVNFTLIFKNGDTVLGTRSITNNTEMRRSIEVSFDAVTAIRLSITKWSKANACAKILQCFDSLSETYSAADLKSFEALHEMCVESGGYSISSDTASVLIFNRDRKFDKGYLKELMVLDRKVKLYLGTEDDEEISYDLIGTYYSDEWDTAQDSQWVKCSCVDKMLRLQDKTYVGLPLTRNLNLYNIAKDIVTSAGFKDGKYLISNSLKSETIPMAYLPKQSVWDALQTLANAAPCRIFMSGDDIINIVLDTDTKTESEIEINKRNMFSYSSTISQMAYANRISVDYCDVTLAEEESKVAETSVSLDAYSSIELTLTFSKDVSEARAVCSNSNITITSFKAGANACTFKVTNTVSITQSGTITAYGKEIETSFKTVTVEDEESLRSSGVTEYTHPQSSLIQSATKATTIANLLLSRMKKGEGVVITEWRGSPELSLNDKYVSKDRFNEESTLVCEYNKFSFDGALRQQIRGRKVQEE